MWMPEETQSWTLIENTQVNINAAIAQGAMYLTNCAFSEPPLKGPEERKDMLNLAPVRFGHLHFDLDAEDPKRALRELRLLIQTLLDFGIHQDAIGLWYSGKKGFHARVNDRSMGKDAYNGDRFLPLIYKVMAETIAKGLKTVDHSIYCMGFGRQYRIPNVKRNNGRYKIPITFGEVMDDIEGLSVSEFEQLACNPREL
jgi:hypothetical protein